MFYLHDLLFFPMFKALQCLHRFSRFFNHIHSGHNWQNWHGIACYQVGSVGNAACTNITWVLWESIYSAFKAGTSHSSLPVMALLVVEGGGWGLGAPKYCLQQSVISSWSTVNRQSPSRCCRKGWRSSGFPTFLTSGLFGFGIGSSLCLIFMKCYSFQCQRLCSVSIDSSDSSIIFTVFITGRIGMRLLVIKLAQLAMQLVQILLGCCESQSTAHLKPEPVTPPCLWWPFWWWKGVDGA